MVRKRHARTSRPELRRVTPFWLWVSMGCALSALLGFSAVRFAIPELQAVAGRVLERSPAPEPEPELPAPVLVASVTAVVERAERPPPGSVGPATARTETMRRRAAVSRPAPAPNVPRPDADKLALWARQVRDGERTFTLATDGCRVTWNRRCKHGHPSWLVHLGLAPRAGR
jgi:hypothetical protein